MRGKAITAFIHVFLVIQIALPISYYSCRADPHDERFAWRMFSPMRMARCRTTFTVGDDRKPVRMSSRFHEAWLTVAQRGRRDVVLAMARKLCADNPGQPVRVEMVCASVAGERQRRGGGWNVCEVDAL